VCLPSDRTGLVEMHSLIKTGLRKAAQQTKHLSYEER
jgi:hypothetical protein